MGGTLALRSFHSVCAAASVASASALAVATVVLECVDFRGHRRRTHDHGAVVLLGEVFLQATRPTRRQLCNWSAAYCLRVGANLVERGIDLRDRLFGGFFLARAGSQDHGSRQRDESCWILMGLSS